LNQNNHTDIFIRQIGLPIIAVSFEGFINILPFGQALNEPLIKTGTIGRPSSAEIIAGPFLNV
jgi:hypothetical protein